MEFTWFATAWDNDDLFHRLAMLLAMLLVIVMAAGIASLLKGKGDSLFVWSYAGLQMLLIVMFVRVWPHAGRARGLVRDYMIGDAIGAAVMVGSLFVDPPLRYWIWAAAVAVLMIAPAFAVRAYEGQPFDSRHIPERYGLFTIIVLGEGVVAVTAGLSDVSLDGGSVASALLGFGIAAAIWYAYFETVSSSALSRERVGASFLWGYGHLFAFAGIAAAAVGVELAIEAGAHGDHALSWATRLMVCAGPAAFLLALAAIHKTTIRAWDAVMTQRMGAIAVLLGGGGVRTWARAGAPGGHRVRGANGDGGLRRRSGGRQGPGRRGRARRRDPRAGPCLRGQAPGSSRSAAQASSNAYASASSMGPRSRRSSIRWSSASPTMRPGFDAEVLHDLGAVQRRPHAPPGSPARRAARCVPPIRPAAVRTAPPSSRCAWCSPRG